MDDNETRIYLSGNKGGDFFDLTIRHDKTMHLKVGHCCLNIIDAEVPVEFLTGILATAVLDAGSVRKALFKLHWQSKYLDQLAEKIHDFDKTVCPFCGEQLKPDEEYSQKYYGETPMEGIPPEAQTWYCADCEIGFNGLGDEV